MAVMTEDELRQRMVARSKLKETLPLDRTVRYWARESGKSIDEVKRLYGEVIGDPDPWGIPDMILDDGR
jgi:hypothetical protein